MCLYQKILSLISDGMSKHKIVVAGLPAFNEERHIASVILRVSEYVDHVIICDDGSSDLTSEIAEALGAIVVKHEHNRGYGAAIRTLFKAAIQFNADILVTLDTDDQHDPSEILSLVQNMTENELDVVIGSRFLENNGSDIPSWRKKGIEFINLISTSGSDVSDSQSGFRAYNKKTIKLLKLTENGMGISTEILLKAVESNLTIGEVPISVRYHEGSSTHNPVVHGVGVVFSTIKHLSINRPLMIYGLPGLTALLISMVMWYLTIRSYLQSNVFSTNLAIISMVSTLIGLSLLSTSVLIWVMTSIADEDD